MVSLPSSQVPLLALYFDFTYSNRRVTDLVVVLWVRIVLSTFYLATYLEPLAMETTSLNSLALLVLEGDPNPNEG